MVGEVIEKPVAPRGPILRYCGGKWKLAEWIIAHFPPHRVYVEPYAGAASVLMQKPRSRMEIINDLDGEVVNVFRVLRDPARSARLEELLALTPFAREEFDLSYKRARNRVEQARRTILRGFMGCSTRGTSGAHRTGFRFSDAGGIVAEKVWGRYPDRVAAFCSRLKGVVIEHKPALILMEQLDATRSGEMALYYADPPYPHSTRQAGSMYARSYRNEMSDGEHRDLAALLHRVRGMVVISGYRCALYDELYADWQRFDHTAYAYGGRRRTESIWLSPRTMAGLNGSLELGYEEGAKDEQNQNTLR